MFADALELFATGGLQLGAWAFRFQCGEPLRFAVGKLTGGDLTALAGAPSQVHQSGRGSDAVQPGRVLALTKKAVAMPMRQE